MDLNEWRVQRTTVGIESSATDIRSGNQGPDVSLQGLIWFSERQCMPLCLVGHAYSRTRLSRASQYILQRQTCTFQ